MARYEPSRIPVAREGMRPSLREKGHGREDKIKAFARGSCSTCPSVECLQSTDTRQSTPAG